MAVTQRDVKRMLAYSSIANAGYMLVAVATNSRTAVAALFVYLAAYAAMNLGAFGVVLALEHDDGSGTTLDNFAGLARRHPWLAAAMAVFLFALAGVPATAGFVAKYYIFYAAIVGGHLELAVIGLMASVLGVFYYLRVVWAMYFVEPPSVPMPSVADLTARIAGPIGPPTIVATSESGAGGVAVAEPAVAATAPSARSAHATSTGIAINPGTKLALAVAVLLTIGLGVVPGGIFDLAQQAAAALFR
jgi:NADH-quinone oxidoreductase subunit N